MPARFTPIAPAAEHVGKAVFVTGSVRFIQQNPFHGTWIVDRLPCRIVGASYINETEDLIHRALLYVRQQNAGVGIDLHAGPYIDIEADSVIVEEANYAIADFFSWAEIKPLDWVSDHRGDIVSPGDAPEGVVIVADPTGAGGRYTGGYRFDPNFELSGFHHVMTVNSWASVTSVLDVADRVEYERERRGV